MLPHRTGRGSPTRCADQRRSAPVPGNLAAVETAYALKNLSATAAGEWTGSPKERRRQIRLRTSEPTLAAASGPRPELAKHPTSSRRSGVAAKEIRLRARTGRVVVLAQMRIGCWRR
jgi:hypothetical protein